MQTLLVRFVLHADRPQNAAFGFWQQKQ